MVGNYILLNRIIFSMVYNHRKTPDSVKKTPKVSRVIGAATVKTIMISTLLNTILIEE